MRQYLTKIITVLTACATLASCADQGPYVRVTRCIEEPAPKQSAPQTDCDQAKEKIKEGCLRALDELSYELEKSEKRIYELESELQKAKKENSIK